MVINRTNTGEYWVRGVSVALHKLHGVLICLIFACLVGQVKEGTCHIEFKVVIIEGSRVDDCGEDDGVFSVRKEPIVSPWAVKVCMAVNKELHGWHGGFEVGA